MNRNFTATAANELWLVDITEDRTREGKLYLCAVKDVFSRRGNVTGCVVHSDRGSQFRSRKFLRALEYYGLVGSMGRVGAAGDNAAVESFFALVQKKRPQPAILDHQGTVADSDCGVY